jgi:hypothetical protein
MFDKILFHAPYYFARGTMRRRPFKLVAIATLFIVPVMWHPSTLPSIHPIAKLLIGIVLLTLSIIFLVSGSPRESFTPHQPDNTPYDNKEPISKLENETFESNGDDEDRHDPREK